MSASGAGRSPVRLLFIGGTGRSGSSLLERILDQSERLAAFGEIDKLFWSIETFDKRQLCGCGEPFATCPFWDRVITASFGSMAEFDPPALAAERDAVASRRHLKALFFGLGDADYERRARTFAAKVQRLYEQLSAACGHRTIVDSSKDPIWAAFLLKYTDFQINFLHLIRHPGAVAYSWQRVKQRPEITWETRMMNIFGARDVANRWLKVNLLCCLVRPRAHRSLGLSYERFARDPRGTLRAIARLVELPPTGLDAVFNDDGSIELTSGHTVMGNPSRMATSVRVHPDEEWRQQLSAADRRIVRQQTWPLLPLLSLYAVR